MRRNLTPMMLDDDCMAIVNHLNNLRNDRRTRPLTNPSALHWMAYAGAAAASGREWLTKISENEARSSPEED